MIVHLSFIFKKYEWNTDAVFNKTQMIYKQLDEIISNYQAVGFVVSFSITIYYN